MRLPDPTPTRRRLRALAVLAAAAVAVAACSSETSVGSAELTEGLEGGDGGLRLGETTTVPPLVTTAPPDAGTATTAPPTTAPATTAPQTTTTAPTVVFEIAINPDGVGEGQFEPRVAQVFVGTIVRWVNRDTTTRSVVANDGSFASGDIPPGGVWEYRADTPGTFNYGDGTRPYAQGTLQVLS